jgi:SecD/SecF fusion protein
LAKGGSAVPHLYALKVPRGGEPKLDGSSITNAYQDFDMKGDVEVIMQMDAEGAQTWKVMTGDNVGKAVAIVLDNWCTALRSCKARSPVADPASAWEPVT